MKTYRALRHDVVRKKQAENSNIVHHPNEKISQLDKFITGDNYKILELFAGHGNLTEYYSNHGDVTSIEKNKKTFEKLFNRCGRNRNVSLINGDSYKEIHRIIYSREKYNIIDIDPYGFPNRLFPHIFTVIDEGYIFLTMPKPYVNILNGITQDHLISYYGEQNPSLETIIKRIAWWGICYWRKVIVEDYIDCKSIWRIVLSVKKVKATEYTGVKNRNTIEPFKTKSSSVNLELF